MTELPTTAQVIADYYQRPWPASVAHDPVLLAYAIFGMFSTSVLAIGWLIGIVREALANPQPFFSMATQSRLIVGLLVFAMLISIAPDAVLFICWHNVAPTTRYHLSLINRTLDGSQVYVFAAAVVIAAISGKRITHKLVHSTAPMPRDLMPSWRGIGHILSTLALVAIVSFLVVVGQGIPHAR